MPKSSKDKKPDKKTKEEEAKEKAKEEEQRRKAQEFNDKIAKLYDDADNFLFI